jgi:hypothetical protein
VITAATITLSTRSAQRYSPTGKADAETGDREEGDDFP